MLRRLGFEFTRSAEVGDEREVNHHHVFAAMFIAKLTHRLYVGQRLDVTYGTTNFGDHNFVLASVAQLGYAVFNLIGDVRNDLHRFAEVVSFALLVDYGLVDAPCGYVVGLRSRHIQKPLIVAKVEVGFCAIICHVALPMFIGVERARIYIDVGVKFLNGYAVAAAL